MLQIRQVLTAAELRQLREFAQRAQWEDGRATTGDLIASQKRNEQVDLLASSEGRTIAQVVRLALQRHPWFTTVALPARVSAPLLNRYSVGMEYGAHLDSAIMGEGDPIRTDLSATLFLVEPDEYDGGELVIQSAQGPQNAKLSAGDLLLYPSTSVHSVAPVRRGQRIAVIFWVQSMVRDAQQRALLLELSQLMSSLQPTLGNSADFNRLNSCYNNLLRMWAQP